MRLLVLGLALAWAAGAAPIYTVRNLGAAGASATTAFDISNSGSIAGTAATRFGPLSVNWTGGEGTVLGTISEGDAVNANGAVAGTSYAGGRAQATVWENGQERSVGGAHESSATGINDSGQVVGARIVNGRSRAFVDDGAQVIDISTPGWWAAAYDVSSVGQVVGTYAEGAAFRAFSWTADGGTKKLGTLGGSSSYAHAVSDDGAVVGTSFVRTGYLHAFLFDGMMQDLGTLGGRLSAAYSINSYRQVVGYSLDARGQERAFVWMDGMMYDLNSLVEPTAGWTLEAAYGINDHGQIVGQARYNGVTSAFVLDALPGDDGALPPDSAAAVPEPSTGLMVFGAACCLGLAAAMRTHRSTVRADRSTSHRL